MALLCSTLIIVLSCQFTNAGIGSTSVEFDRNFTTLRHGGRGYDNGCKCSRPDQYRTFDDKTYCKPKSESRFPAHVAECQCKACKLNITLHCTCDEYNNPKSWKAAKDVCEVGYSAALRTTHCYDSPPTNAVMDFDRCRKGYLGETAQARCWFSCRTVEVICESNGIWQYRNENDRCLGDEGFPTYSDTNSDGLSFTIFTNGSVSDFTCPAGHTILQDNENPAECRNGLIVGNFPTCVINPIQITEPTAISTPTTMPTFQGKVIQTEPFPLQKSKENHTETNSNAVAPLGWVEYVLIVVIVVFLVFLTALWSWYVKDKMRETRVKRAAVDNRNGHPCIL